MSSQKERDNFFKRTGESVVGGKPIKELPRASDILASLAKTDDQRAALALFDEKHADWIKVLGNTIKT